MENILKWAASMSKSQKKDPSKKVQEELCTRVNDAITYQKNTFDECVGVVCDFSPNIVAPFYSKQYAKFSQDIQKGWDRAFIRWANQKKPEKMAAVRTVFVLKWKLQYFQDVEHCSKEVGWILEKNTDSLKSYIETLLKERFDELELKKLLSLDISGLDKKRKARLYDLFHILFDNSTLEEVQKEYASFLLNHVARPESKKKKASEPKPEPKSEAVPAKEAPDTNEQPVEPEKTLSSVEEVKTPAIEKDKTPAVAPVLPANEPEEADNSAEEKTVVEEKPQEEHKEPVAPVSSEPFPRDGETLLNELAQWMKAQKASVARSSDEIAKLNIELEHAHTQQKSLSASLQDTHRVLDETNAEKRSLQQTITSLSAELSEEKAEKRAIKDTVATVQQMADNSIKQELSGFKSQLGDALKNDIKDLRCVEADSEMDAEEKMQVYQDIMGTILDTLKHYGIAIEVN